MSSLLSDLFGKSGSIILKGLAQNKPLDEIIESLPKKMRGNADVISATIPASIPPVVLVLLQSYLKLVFRISISWNHSFIDLPYFIWMNGVF